MCQPGTGAGISVDRTPALSQLAQAMSAMLRRPVSLPCRIAQHCETGKQRRRLKEAIC
ncbi:hypothetical protein APV28_4381 [Comamonas testosteroni]|nr:hypothetical protein APV28_4381 [Comamonas testosteroni]